MDYEVSGKWPSGYRGITFANVAGNLRVNVARVPFTILGLGRGSVITFEQDTEFADIFNLQSDIEFRATKPVSVRVSRAS
jgi:hypothetical protein